jgi:crotonobetainyl-CoA:carnitine CoA-transferase CaiB-like acyl-CoA transferase
MGRPDLETDERFATQVARCSRRPEVRAIVEAWLQSFDNDAAALAALAQARVPSAPILDIVDVPKHPQHASREVFQQLPHPELGNTPVARSPFRLSTLEMSIPFRAPYLGEHNEEILSQQLGYSADKIAALYAGGVIAQDKQVETLRAAGKL